MTALLVGSHRRTTWSTADVDRLWSEMEPDDRAACHLIVSGYSGVCFEIKLDPGTTVRGALELWPSIMQ